MTSFFTEFEVSLVHVLSLALCLFCLVSHWKRGKLSGPCTNCPDMTLGRQQHALSHTITFYYTSANDRDSNHSVRLVPWLNA